MEIDIIKRETTGMGPNVYHENDTIAKYEIMDGAPVRGEPLSVSFFLFSSQLVTKWVSEINTVCVGTLGESIPIRLFLAGYEMTPTMRDINKKFSVRYYLNLVLIDEEERRYFKQQVGRLNVSPNKRQRELIKEQTRQLKSELVACRSLKKDETKFKLLLLRFWQLMKTRGLPSSVVPFVFNYLFEIKTLNLHASA